MNHNPEYEIRITSHAQRDLDRLPLSDYRRIDARIGPLAHDPRPHGVVKLQDKAHRIRIGPWRVIYLIDDSEKLILVQAIRRRGKDTYR